MRLLNIYQAFTRKTNSFRNIHKHVPAWVVFGVGSVSQGAYCPPAFEMCNAGRGSNVFLFGKWFGVESSQMQKQGYCRWTKKSNKKMSVMKWGAFG